MGIVEVLSTLGTGVATMFTSVLAKLSTIFFEVTEAGAINVTALGYIALISLVLAVTWRLFNFIKSLIKGR